MTDPYALILAFPDRLAVAVFPSHFECALMAQPFLAWAQAWCVPAGWVV